MPGREGAGMEEMWSRSQRAQPLELAQGQVRENEGKSHCLSKGVQDPLCQLAWEKGNLQGVT